MMSISLLIDDCHKVQKEQGLALLLLPLLQLTFLSSAGTSVSEDPRYSCRNCTVVGRGVRK